MPVGLMVPMETRNGRQTAAEKPKVATRVRAIAGDEFGAKMQEFDSRYPAMFQPGGEHLIEDNFVYPAAEIPEAAAPKPVAQAQARVPTQRAFVPEEPGAESDPADLVDEAADEPPPGWGSRTWVLALAAIGGVAAAATFCLMATVWIPESNIVNMTPTSFEYAFTQPWGQAIAPAASPLYAAALGLLCGVFLLASRSYLNHAYWFYGAAVLVAAVTVAAGTVALFSENIFAGVLYYSNPDGPPDTFQMVAPLQLYYLREYLVLLTPVMVSALLIWRPTRSRRKRVATARDVVAVGGGLAAFALWALLAQTIHPLVQGSLLEQGQNQGVLLQPWTVPVSTIGAPILAAGASLVVAGLLLAGRQKTQNSPLEEFAEPQSL